MYKQISLNINNLEQNLEIEAISNCPQQDQEKKHRSDPQNPGGPGRAGGCTRGCKGCFPALCFGSPYVKKG